VSGDSITPRSVRSHERRAGRAGPPVLLERLFALLHDCRAVVPQLEAGGDSEPMSAQAERLL
jgi:hypothetical protein